MCVPLSEFLLNVSAVFTCIIVIYYDDAERKGSGETDTNSRECCIVGKVIGPVRFLAENIRLPPPALDSFQKTDFLYLRLTGNVHCTSSNFI